LAAIKKVKKVLVVTQYFWPENFRVNELVREFKNRGYIVEVLTSTPNYPRGKVFPDFASNPKKYNDYFGVKIHRVPQISRHNNKVSLALNYFSFVISACIYSIINLRKKSFDLIFGVQLSPIFSMIPAIICKKIMRIPLYMWVLDVWPDSLISAGVRSKLILSFLNKICVSIYSSANLLFLSSNGFETKLNKMGVKLPKLVYFPQWIESDYLGKAPLDNPASREIKQVISKYKDKVIFTFTGNIGEAQDFPNVLKGLKKCLNINNIVILIIGDGRYKEELIHNIKAEGLAGNVYCLGEYSSSYMPYFYYYSDYLLLSLSDTPIFSYTLPGKVQSYMSSGKPLVGMVSGEASHIIKEAGCGYTVESGDYNGFSKILDNCCSLSEESRKKLGNMGKVYAYENFRFETLVDKMLKYF